MLEILIRNRWVKVPKDRILPESFPDGGVHACYSDPAPYMTETTPGLITLKASSPASISSNRGPMV